MLFLDAKEKAEFEAHVAQLTPLLKEPHAAVHYLTDSLRETDRAIGAIRKMIDEHEEDDFGPLVHRIEESLREIEAHLCGTDIGFASDFGAWRTKSGWGPGRQCPMAFDHEDQCHEDAMLADEAADAMRNLPLVERAIDTSLSHVQRIVSAAQEDWDAKHRGKPRSP